MSFNVRYDELFYDAANISMDNWPNRREFQVALLNFYKPDVIGMQEPLGHQVQYFAENMSDYKWIGVGREDGINEGEYNPIFYKKDKIEALSSGTFWLSQNPETVSKSWDSGYTRICSWALFQLKESGSKFYFFNTHFDSKGENARLESAKLINEKINDLDTDIPVIVTGDFNFTEDSEVYTEITSNGLSDSKKASIEEPYGPEGTFNGFKFNRTPKHRIDYIFVNQRIKVLRYGVLTDSNHQRYPSDHFPVNIYVEIPR
ncbi:endonuclease [Arenibacter certesii]|uniref:Endonuclease n=2 Tax=Arenibacter certesii TaxID=228955 RepID=A0A918MMU1_9FLAO|nr:endonuclease [Arenibacter certesii]